MKRKTTRLRGSYVPDPRAQASTMFASLAVAVRAGLRGGFDAEMLFRRFREKFEQYGIDIMNDDDPKVAAYEREVQLWLSENQTKQ